MYLQKCIYRNFKLLLCLKRVNNPRGVFRNLFRVVSRGGGAQQSVGLNNPHKTIDFTDQGGGGLNPRSHPPENVFELTC